MEEKSCVRKTGVTIEMVDAFPVENARTADDVMDFVAFGEKELSEVRAVLAGDSGDQYSFHQSTPCGGFPIKCPYFLSREQCSRTGPYPHLLFCNHPGFF